MGLRSLYLVAVLFCWHDRSWAQNTTEYDLSDYKIWWIGRNLGEDVKSERIIGGAAALYINCNFPHGQQYWPHPSNCQMFVQCGPSGPVERECPTGTAWSQSLLTCDHLQNTDCDLSKSQGTGSCHYWCNNDSGEPYCCEPANTSEISSTSRYRDYCHPCNFNANGRFPHPTNCERYIECYQSQEFDRACAPGTTYIPEKEACGWSRDYPCVTASFNNTDGSCQYDNEIVEGSCHYWCINKVGEPYCCEPADTDRIISPSRECGYAATRPRIVGGKKAIKSYPWFATIVHRSDPGFAVCGGSLIDKKWVLTAAHCFYFWTEKTFKIQDAIILLGHDNLSLKSSFQYTPKRLIRHSGFKADADTLIKGYGTYKHDIALLELETPVHIDERISPICLPSADYPYIHISAKVIGYGYLRNGERPSKLMELNVKTLDNHECMKKGKRYTGIFPSQMCAWYQWGQEGRDACGGDSGGPLMKLEGSQYVQIGIVSTGPSRPCGQKGKPGIYTRVSKYLNWIRNNTNGYWMQADVYSRN